MKKRVKKLSLSRETLRMLENRRLHEVPGGTDEEETGGEFGSRSLCATCPRTCNQATCESVCAGCTA